MVPWCSVVEQVGRVHVINIGKLDRAVKCLKHFIVYFMTTCQETIIVEIYKTTPDPKCLSVGVIVMKDIPKINFLLKPFNPCNVVSFHPRVIIEYSTTHQSSGSCNFVKGDLKTNHLFFCCHQMH